MKYISRILICFLLTVPFFSAVALGPLKLDPSNDNAFEISPQSHFLSQASQGRVKEVFLQRLRLEGERVTPELAERLAGHLITLCRRYQFDPAFVLALIQVESSFRIDVVSHAGAEGLTQVMPATARVILRKHGARDLGLKSRRMLNLKDPFQNLTFGVTYLSWLRARYQGRSPYYTVAAYNLGPSRLDELVSRKGFKPVKTKRYFEEIRRHLFRFRHSPDLALLD